MTPWSCPRCRLQHLLVPTASSPRCSRCDAPLELAPVVEACDDEHGEATAACADCDRWICLACRDVCPPSSLQPAVSLVRCTSCAAARAN